MLFLVVMFYVDSVYFFIMWNDGTSNSSSHGDGHDDDHDHDVGYNVW